MLFPETSKDSYPFPRWQTEIISVVRRAIWHAWITVIDGLEQPGNYPEEALTEKLQLSLTDLLDSSKCSNFNRQKFSDIEREASYRDFKGKSIKKQPDLIIKPIGRDHGLASSLYNGLFIECKVIDHAKTPHLYIIHGVRRYVDGEYAWAMSHAVMIGYVKNGAQLPSAIEESVRRNSENETVKRCFPHGTNISNQGDDSPPPVYRTVHPRNWEHSEYGEPGDIDLDHIWLPLKGGAIRH
ncbi:MAG: hypothetical protein ACR2P9_06485 [Gammaproteobacteria bacterium]